MKEVVRRAGINPEEVDDISYGSCIPAEVALELEDLDPGKRNGILKDVFWYNGRQWLKEEDIMSEVLQMIMPETVFFGHKEKSLGICG